MEKIQKDLAHNHRLIPVQELEEKAVVLKQLGETLTDLKGERGPWGCTSVPSAPPEPTQGPPAACWCLALLPLSCAVPPTLCTVPSPFRAPVQNSRAPDLAAVAEAARGRGDGGDAGRAQGRGGSSSALLQ